MRILVIGLLLSAVAAAQPERSGSRFGESGLEVGDAFPSVSIHNQQGADFNTKSLKGFLTVVVSGCLT